MTALGTVGKYALRLQIAPRKVVQALAALGVTIASEFSYIVR